MARVAQGALQSAGACSLLYRAAVSTHPFGPPRRAQAKRGGLGTSKPPLSKAGWCGVSFSQTATQRFRVLLAELGNIGDVTSAAPDPADREPL